MVGLVAGRFNVLNTTTLSGALMLNRTGADEDLEVAWVPGLLKYRDSPQAGFEEQYDHGNLPGSGNTGSHSHFDYVAGEVAKGVAKDWIGLRHSTIFGVITAEQLSRLLSGRD